MNTEIEALRTIAEFPITDPKNMDAVNMRMIALAALAGKEVAAPTHPQAEPEGTPTPPADPIRSALEWAAHLVRAERWNSGDWLYDDREELAAAILASEPGLRLSAAAPQAEPASAGELTEAVAKAIYEQWINNDGYKPWADRGNSLKQDEARDIARAALRTAQPVADAKLVPMEFLRGFLTLAHNYSLRAVPPDYYRGVEGDAFSVAYKRCGEDLAKLRAMLDLTPVQPVPASEPASQGVTDAERSIISFCMDQMDGLSDADWRQHGFRQRTYERASNKLRALLNARSEAQEGSAK
jgi:hypothetical protein